MNIFKRIFPTSLLIAIQLISWINTLILKIGYNFKKRAALAKYQEIIDFAKTQNLPLDTTKNLKLPPHLVDISHDGSVKIFHTSDGRHYIVIIIQYSVTTTVKFQGILAGDAALTPREWSKIPGAPINMLGEYQKPYEVTGPFTNLYITRRYNDCLFEVKR
ncbi:MAG: hypothetical protein HEQ35_04345 [Gloeotrichia echinulata IR180]